MRRREDGRSGYAQAGVKRCCDKGLDVQRFDVTRDALPFKEAFDVVVSMEVAEHLPEIRAEPFVDLLVEAA